jgi:hypothetical protein
MKDANYAPVYCALYPKLAEIARSFGYALSIHGTLGRDMDLILVPWTDEPSTFQTVIDAFVSKFSLTAVDSISIKNHGRRVQTLSLAFGECFIDLSCMPSKHVTSEEPTI